MVPMKMRVSQLRPASARSSRQEVTPRHSKRLAGRSIQRDLRIETPLSSARSGIERDHLVKGEQKTSLSSTRIGVASNSACAPFAGASPEVAGREAPGLDQAADIVGGDLVKRRKARATTVATPMLPSKAGATDRTTSARFPPIQFLIEAQLRRSRPSTT